MQIERKTNPHLGGLIIVKGSFSWFHFGNETQLDALQRWIANNPKARERDIDRAAASIGCVDQEHALENLRKTGSV